MHRTFYVVLLKWPGITTWPTIISCAIETHADKNKGNRKKVV